MNIVIEKFKVEENKKSLLKIVFLMLAFSLSLLVMSYTSNAVSIRTTDSELTKEYEKATGIKMKDVDRLSMAIEKKHEQHKKIIKGVKSFFMPNKATQSPFNHFATIYAYLFSIFIIKQVFDLFYAVLH